MQKCFIFVLRILLKSDATLSKFLCFLSAQRFSRASHRKFLMTQILCLNEIFAKFKNKSIKIYFYAEIELISFKHKSIFYLKLVNPRRQTDNAGDLDS